MEAGSHVCCGYMPCLICAVPRRIPVWSICMGSVAEAIKKNTGPVRWSPRNGVPMLKRPWHGLGRRTSDRRSGDWYGGAGWELKCLYLCLCGCTASIFWPEHGLHGHSHEELWKWICRLRCHLVGWGVPGPVEEFSWGRRGRALPFLALVLWPGNRNIFGVLMVTAKSVLLRVTNGYYI